ncbi:hypothetical protein BX600DRAFT_510194 [Xylariales sp. PMI_506]|nr:hypothetical protein BX600DRAFT_510194 [Xylariales sp. PMI_506]
MNAQILRRAALSSSAAIRTAAPRRFASTSSTAPQSADWGRLFMARGKQVAFFLPTAAVVLGWPYAAYKVVDFISS